MAHKMTQQDKLDEFLYQLKEAMEQKHRYIPYVILRHCVQQAIEETKEFVLFEESDDE